MISDIQIERQCLGGLIRFPTLFPDIDNLVSENDFANRTNRVVYSCLRSSLIRNEEINQVLLAHKIKNMGIVMHEDLDIETYIKNLCSFQVNEKGTMESFEDLIKCRVRREIDQTADRLKEHIKSCGNMKLDQIIGRADEIYNSKISSFSFDEGPIQLFKDIEAILEERGQNPDKEIGFPTPFSELNRRYGGYRKQNLYAYVSRSGEGKSTLLAEIGRQMSIAALPILYLDTEMSTNEVRERMVAAQTGVPLYYITTGKYYKNPELLGKVRGSFKDILNLPFWHYHVRNKSIEEIASIARRWKYLNVGRDEPALLIYDYFKLTNDKIDKGWLETQAIGAKVDRFKRLLEELDVPGLSAMQLNRTGENFNRKAGDFADDSTAISVSDRLLWFASYVGIFRRKTEDELALDTDAFGTHKLITLKARTQGEDSPGHQDYVVKQIDKKHRKYIRFYLNFKVKNFKVESMGSALDVIKADQKKEEEEKKSTECELV